MPGKRKNANSFRPAKRRRFYRKRGSGVRNRRRLLRQNRQVERFTLEKHRSHVTVWETAVPQEGIYKEMVWGAGQGEHRESHEGAMRDGYKIRVWSATLKLHVKVLPEVTTWEIQAVRLMVVRWLKNPGTFTTLAVPPANNFNLDLILDRSVYVAANPTNAMGGALWAPLQRKNLGIIFKVLVDKIIMVDNANNPQRWYQRTIRKGLYDMKYTGDLATDWSKNMIGVFLFGNVKTDNPQPARPLATLYNTSMISNI